MSARIPLPQNRIGAFCRTWRITELDLFGSVLREDFHDDSDVDVMVSFAADARWTFDDLLAMEEELGKLLGRRVEFVERSVVEGHRNYLMREHILTTAQRVYAA